MRRANRRDCNHVEIIQGFKNLGWQTLDTADLKNCFDVLVSKQGVTISCEIKDGKKVPSARKLTKGELEFKERWQGNYEIVTSLTDVDNIDRRWFPF